MVLFLPVNTHDTRGRLTLRYSAADFTDGNSATKSPFRLNIRTGLNFAAAIRLRALSGHACPFNAADMCILRSSLRCRPRNVSEIRFRRSAVTGIPLLFSDIRFLASSLKHPFIPLFHAVRVMSFRWFGVPLPPLFMLYPFSLISDRFSRIQNFSRSFSSSCVWMLDSSTTQSKASSPYFRIAAWKTQRSRLLRAAPRCSRRRFPNLVVVWPMYHFSVTVFLAP